MCIISRLFRSSRSQTERAAGVTASQPHCPRARFVLADIIWHLTACMHIPASSLCLLDVFDSNSPLSVYENQMIWEKGFCLGASALVQRSGSLQTRERAQRSERTCLRPGGWHNCCWQGADQERGGNYYSLCALEKKKSERLLLKWVDNS